MDNLSDLTIVIPTFERPLFAQRTMSYWSCKLPKVIVLDGSVDSLDEKFLTVTCNQLWLSLLNFHSSNFH